MSVEPKDRRGPFCPISAARDYDGVRHEAGNERYVREA
jgi:hypothetical protein